jgi:hypothetical protein
MEQRCISLKSDGVRCTRNHVDGHRCRQHAGIFQDNIDRYGPLREGGCHIIQDNRRWCPHNALPNDIVCDHHRRVFDRRRQRQEQIRAHEQNVRDNVQQLMAQNPMPTWRQVVDAFMDDTAVGQRLAWDIGLRFFHRTQPGGATVNFVQYISWIRRGRVGPPPVDIQIQQLAAAAANPLARLAGDPQNVHTAPVSQQTNMAMEKLLETASKITRRYRAPDWLAAKWLVMSYGQWSTVRRVVDDMYVWYTRDSCRSQGDWLYRKALDGLYELIRTIPNEETRQELVKRAFEECSESVSMCCEGHLSRLCNVMVGFDDAFMPPVSTAEILQNKMGAISLMDISTEEKIEQAKKVLEELGVPSIEHEVWLEAF